MSPHLGPTVIPAVWTPRRCRRESQCTVCATASSSTRAPASPKEDEWEAVQVSCNQFPGLSASTELRRGETGPLKRLGAQTSRCVAVVAPDPHDGYDRESARHTRTPPGLRTSRPASCSDAIRSQSTAGRIRCQLACADDRETRLS